MKFAKKQKAKRARKAKTKEDVEADEKSKLSDYKRQAHKKVWICLFTCATTRAIQLEAMDELSITAFINSFRRFIALRLIPRSVISDNAGTFLALKKYLRDLEDQRIQTMFKKK